MALLIDLILNPKFGVGGSLNKADSPEAASEDLQHIRAWLAKVPRFALNVKSTEFVQALPAQLTPTSASQAKMPYGAFWIETAWQAADDDPGRKNRFGILYTGHDTDRKVMHDIDQTIAEGSLTRGGMAVVIEDGYNTAITSFVLDVPDCVPSVLDADPDRWGAMVKMQTATYQSLRQWMGGKPVPLDGEGLPSNRSEDISDDVDFRVLEFIRKVGLFMCSFGIVMASPKVYERREVDMIRLNRQRVKSKKHPLANHTVIDITATPPDKKIVRVTSGGEMAEHGKKQRHPVRFFTRIKGGKLETVTPHWRGDAALGTKTGNYRVK